MARQAFSIGFGKSQPFYFSDSPFLRGYSVLAFGESLFETLALNLLPYYSERPIPWLGDDLPAWEQPQPAAPDPGGTPVRGYADYLTWQSRRIHLVPEGNPVVVRRCQIRQNLKAADLPRDPFKCYVEDRTQGRYARGFNPDRALWRDSHVLFQRTATTTTRPDAFNHLARIDGARRAGGIQARSSYDFGAFGFATDPGKAASVVLWRQERLPLPLAYLEDDRLVERLRTVLDAAEGVAQALRGSVRTLAKLLVAPGSDDRDARQPDPRDVQRVADGLAPGRRYWSRLEVPFKGLLMRLRSDRTEEEGEDEDGERELAIWRGELRRAANAAFAETTRGLDGSARALKAVAKAQRAFNARLREALDEDGEGWEEDADGTTA